MTEWVVIEGFARYELSIGGVRNKRTGNELKLSKGSGYATISLVDDNNQKRTVRFHRLLAMHFIDNSDNLPIVNHKDGNKLNNNLENLEWVSHSENRKHAIDNKLSKNRVLGTSMELLDEHNNVIREFVSVTKLIAYIGCGKSAIRYNFEKRDRTNIFTVMGHRVRYKPIESIEGELWKPLNTQHKHMNKRYQASNMGRIKNVETEQLVRPVRNKQYYYVGLSNSGNGKNQRLNMVIHRLVAFAFFGGDYESNHQVNHIDKNQSNNKLSNLEILSPQEHQEKDHGRPVLGINIENHSHKMFKSVTAAVRHFGSESSTHISRTIQRCGTAYGHFWVYLDDVEVINLLREGEVEIIYH